MSRRGVLGVVAGLAGLAVFGGIVVGARPTPSVDAEPSAWASRVVEEPVEETQGASLQTTDGDLYLDVPADWQIVNEGDLLLLSGSDGAYRVAARVPEVPRGTENDLRREAEYLRDGFEATGKPAFTDESTRQYDILRMQTPGTFSGEEVVEQVTYLVEPERSRGLVVSLLLPASPTPSEGRAARGMVDDLLRLFKEL